MKKLAARLLVFVLLVFALQAVIGKYDFEFHNLKLLRQFLKERKDILYLTDCTNYYLGKDDKDRRKISELLEEMVPAYSLGCVYRGAYHMDIFLEYCKYISRQKNKPRLIIIPINMRAFSPLWDRDPTGQFEKQKIILKDNLKSKLIYAFNRPLKVFNYNFFEIGWDEYYNTPVYDGKERIGVVKDFLDRSLHKHTPQNMKKQFVLRYMFSLSEAHGKMQSLLEIADVLKRSNIKVLFYLTPIDYEMGEKYLPGRFKQRLAENAHVIRSALARKGIALLDLSTGLKADSFSWQGHYPHERLNERGRRFIAERVAERVKRIL